MNQFILILVFSGKLYSGLASYMPEYSFSRFRDLFIKNGLQIILRTVSVLWTMFIKSYFDSWMTQVPDVHESRHGVFYVYLDRDLEMKLFRPIDLIKYIGE